MRKRVLFLIPNMGGGGAERVVATLLRHLDRTKFEPILGIVDHSRNEFGHLIPEDVRTFDLKGRRVRYALPCAVALIWREKPDVVMSTLDHLNVALAMSRPFWPRRAKCALRLTSTLSAEAHPLAMSVLFRFADVLIYQSEAMKAVFDEKLKLPSVPSVVLKNPVDISFIRRSAAERPAHVYDLDGGFNLVGVGRLEPVKGFDIAIEAIALLRDIPLTLTILGDGDREGTMSLIRRNGLEGRVKLAGFEPNPYPLIRRADALLIPSRREGFPNVMLEALAVGTPVIAMPLAGVPEVLSGLPGCAVSAEISPSALAAAIRRALADRRRPSSDVLGGYSAENATRAYEDVFERLADDELRAGTACSSAATGAGTNAANQ